MGDQTWDDVKQLFPVGTEVTGVVQSVHPFGVFIDLGVSFPGLIMVPELAGESPKQIEDYPQIGQMVSAKVLWHRDSNQQVCLTQKSFSPTGQS